MIRRLEISKDVALYKYENSLPVFDKKREEEIIESVRNQAGRYADMAEEIFRILFRESKQVQVEFLEEIKEEKLNNK